MGKKRLQKKVAGKQRKGRVNIMRGLRYHDKKRINFVIKEGNADVVYEQLTNLYKLLLEEWVYQGNKIELFND